MAIIPFCVRVESAEDLEVAVNAALAPLLNDRIFGVEVDQSKQGPFFARNIYCAFSASPGAGVIPTPFQLKTFSAQDESEVLTLINQFQAANPTYFFSEVYFFYRTQTPNPLEGVSAAIFYNITAAAASNWGAGAGSGGPPSGPAGGDLYGNYPAPNVGGLRGVPLTPSVPVSGQSYIFDDLTATFVLAPEVQYFVSGAAAQASAPFINGTFVIIYPGSPTSEAGTYQVTTNNGVSFPADYTKVSDLAETASEIGIVDAGNFYQGNNVEAALQEVGSGLILGSTGVLAVGLNVLDSFPVASCDGGDWIVIVENGASRYKTTLAVTHDGASAEASEYGASPGPGVGIFPITFDADISAGNIRILATATAPGWSYRVRRLALLTV